MPRGQMTRHPSVPTRANTPSFLHNLTAWLQLLSNVTSPADKSDINTSRDRRRETLYINIYIKSPLNFVVKSRPWVKHLVLFQDEQRWKREMEEN